MLISYWSFYYTFFTCYFKLCRWKNFEISMSCLKFTIVVSQPMIFLPLKWISDILPFSTRDSSFILYFFVIPKLFLNINSFSSYFMYHIFWTRIIQIAVNIATENKTINRKSFSWGSAFISSIRVKQKKMKLKNKNNKPSLQLLNYWYYWSFWV